MTNLLKNSRPNMLTSKRLAEIVWKEVTNSSEPGLVIERFGQLIKENGLGYLVPQINRHLEILAARTKSERTLTLSFSHEPAPESIATVKKLVGATSDDTVGMKVDSTLLGGFVATYQYRTHDGSLRQKLKALEQALAR